MKGLFDPEEVVTHRLISTPFRVLAPGEGKLCTCTSAMKSKDSQLHVDFSSEACHAGDGDSAFGVLLGEGKSKTRHCPQVFISQCGQERTSSTAGVCQGSICCSICFTAS